MSAGTSWFWNGAKPSRRRFVAIVFLIASAAWFVVDLFRTPITWSIAVPAFLIVFFAVQWRSASKSRTTGPGAPGIPDPRNDAG